MRRRVGRSELVGVRLGSRRSGVRARVVRRWDRTRALCRRLVHVARRGASRAMERDRLGRRGRRHRPDFQRPSERSARPRRRIRTEVVRRRVLHDRGRNPGEQSRELGRDDVESGRDSREHHSAHLLRRWLGQRASCMRAARYFGDDDDRDSVAAWNRSAWEPLGTDGHLRARPGRRSTTATERAALFLCGGFTRAGAFASARIARWSHTGVRGSTGTVLLRRRSASACPYGNAGAIGRSCGKPALSTAACGPRASDDLADSVTLRVEARRPARCSSGLYQPGGERASRSVTIALRRWRAVSTRDPYRDPPRRRSATRSQATCPCRKPAICRRAAGPRQISGLVRDARGFCTSATFACRWTDARWAP